MGKVGKMYGKVVFIFWVVVGFVIGCLFEVFDLLFIVVEWFKWV